MSPVPILLGIGVLAFLFGSSAGAAANVVPGRTPQPPPPPTPEPGTNTTTTTTVVTNVFKPAPSQSLLDTNGISWLITNQGPSYWVGVPQSIPTADYNGKRITGPTADQVRSQIISWVSSMPGFGGNLGNSGSTTQNAGSNPFGTGVLSNSSSQSTAGNTLNVGMLAGRPFGMRPAMHPVYFQAARTIGFRRVN